MTRVAVMLLVGLLACLVPARAQDRAIDWSKCEQPDLQSQAHKAAVSKWVNRYVSLARTDHPDKHVAVQLNRVYAERIIPERRAHVDQKYIPVGPKRSAGSCALSKADYHQLIAMRDASYLVMCRSEVAAGTSDADRARKELRTLVMAVGYDFIKDLGFDPAARPNEPTTPPGGLDACREGIVLGSRDPLPRAEQLNGFSSHMSLEKVSKLKFDQVNN